MGSNGDIKGIRAQGTEYCIIPSWNCFGLVIKFYDQVTIGWVQSGAEIKDWIVGGSIWFGELLVGEASLILAQSEHDRLVLLVWELRCEVGDVLVTYKDVSGTVIENGMTSKMGACKEVGESILLVKGNANSSKSTLRDI